MKKLVISAMALGLFLAAPAAMAASNDHHHRAGHGHATMQDRQGAQQDRHAQPAVQRSRTADRMHSAAVARNRSATRTSHRTAQRANYATRRANVATHRAVAATRDANHATARADYAVYRANAQSSRQYRGNTYHRPTGWYAHRWTYGERLPANFYGDNYWITDYISFGLMAPPSGLVWVRDDHDALLVDRYTGEIVRVDYDVFY